MLLSIPFLKQSYAGATVAQYLWCLGFILVAMLFRKPFSHLVVKLTSGVAVRATNGKYRGLFKSLMRTPVGWLYVCVLCFAGLSYISIPLSRLTLFQFQQKDKQAIITAAGIADHLFFFFMIVFTALLLSRLTDFIYRAQMEQARHRHENERSQILPLLKELIKGIVWVISFFWILGVVFEVNIPALITGLGIGGVALALAAKESIENLFASLTILTDKPFQVGDTIKIGNLEGKVQRIGFRSARLRGSDGSLYIIPNKKLVDENLENLTQRDTRGVKVTFNIPYGIAEAELQKMIGELKEMIRKTLQVIDPVKVSLDGFNEKVFGVVLSYHLPPVLKNGNEDDIKQEISRKAYGIVMKYTSVAKIATISKTEPGTP